MSEMLDRAAKALCAKMNEGWIYSSSGKPIMQPKIYDWDDPMVRNYCLVLTRTIIEDIREPSEAMIGASSEEGVGWSKDARDHVRNEWQSMIDEILKDG